VHEFNEVGWIPAIVEHVWDVNTILDENPMVGSLLQTLFGYNANPSLTEVISYLGYLAIVTMLWKRDTEPVKAPAVSHA
jgi:high-affinity iron transporter